MRIRELALSFAVLLLLGAPAAAYVVVLKDGSQIIAKEKYRQVGGQAIITLPNGTRSSLAIAEIDHERTQAANLHDYGTAVVFEPGPSRDLRNAPKKGETLSDIAARRSLGDTLQRRSAAPPAAAAEPATAVTTSKGRPDLSRVQRKPLQDTELTTRVVQLLRARGVEEVAVYEGTQPGRVFLEFTTNSEAALFRALEASAQVLDQLTQQRNPVDAFELLMATGERQRAGQFLVTPQRAQQLVSRQLDTPGFFLRYVEF